MFNTYIPVENDFYIYFCPQLSIDKHSCNWNWRQRSPLYWLHYILCWTATVLRALFKEYHSSSTALGHQHPEVTKQPLVCDWWQLPMQHRGSLQKSCNVIHIIFILTYILHIIRCHLHTFDKHIHSVGQYHTMHWQQAIAWDHAQWRCESSKCISCLS